MNVLFFIFPFLLYLGIALQGVSYYFIGITVPSLAYIFSHKKIPLLFKRIGVIFLCLHLIFPVVNFIVYFFPNLNVNQDIYKITLQWPGILKSNFPSTLFFGGMLLILFTQFSNGNHLKRRGYILKNFQPLKYFLAGMVPASVVFLGLMLFSHFTGVDLHTLFRKKIEHFSQNEAFATGGYRVFGFYGHPLTVAGVCLVYSIFSWTLLCSFVAWKNKNSWNFLPGISHQYLPILFLGIITFSNEICVILSGGRTAALVGVFLLIFIPLVFNIRKNFLATMIVVSLVGTGSYFFANKLGILERIKETTTSLSKNMQLDSGNNREYFWKTYKKMIMDKPFIGQGNYWLKEGVTVEYYNKLGMSDLKEKYNAHNVYLETLASVGFLGLTWIAGLFFYLFILLRKYIFSKQENLKPVGLALLFAFAANMLHGFTQNVFFDSSVVYIYICLLLVLLWESTT